MRFYSKLALLAALAASVMASAAAEARDFYSGKTVTLIVGFTPGGGTDLFGRVMAEGLQKHLAGNPNIIVSNRPGAESVVASNYYVEVAKRDGETLMVGTGQLLLRIIFGLEGSKAKLSDYEQLAAVPMGRIIYGLPASRIETVADLKKKDRELILGVPGVISSIEAVLGLEVLGANYRVVRGYPGRKEIALALERGETNVDTQTTPVYETSIRQLVAAKKATPLFAQGLFDAKGNLVRDSAADDVPTVAEVYKELYGKAPEGPTWRAYNTAVTAMGTLGKVLMIHADAPADAKAAVLAAIDAMTKDPAYMERAGKALEGYPIVHGPQLQTNVKRVLATTPEETEWFKDFLSTKFNVRFN